MRIKRYLQYIFGGGLALIFLLGLGTYWLLWTTSGAAWLLSAVSRWTPVSISADQVGGTLANNLRLEELRVSWPEGSAEVSQLELRWRLTSLFGGRLEVDELKVSKVKMRLPASDVEQAEQGGTFSFSWPRLSGLPLRLEAEIKRFEVTDLILIPVAGSPMVIRRIGAVLAWDKRILSVSGLEAASRLGQGRVDLQVGLVDPGLELKAAVTLKEPFANLDHFVLRGELSGTDSSGGNSGTLFFEALSQKKPRYRLKAELGLLKNHLRIGMLALTMPGRPGRIDARGELTLEADPQLSLEGNIAKLNLLKETGVITQVNGKLQIDGRLSSYRGSFHLANGVSGWQGAKLVGQLDGTLQTLAITELKGDWLEGKVKGNIGLNWAEGIEAQGMLICRQLNPEIVNTDWPGQVNLDLNGRVKIPRDKPFSATVKTRLLDSHLRHKTLTGEADAQMTGDHLDIENLQLHGDGFDLAASGKLNERLSIQADIQNLSGLVPEAKGQISVNGWLRWKNSYLSGDLDGLVRAFSLKGLEIERLDLAIHHQQKDKSINVSARGQSFNFQEYRINNFDLGVSGILAGHQGRLDLLWPGGNAHIQAHGGFQEGNWSGRVVDVKGEDQRFGIWELENPANLVVAAKRLVVKKLALASHRGERIHATANLFFHPLRGEVNASFERLALAKANPWLREMKAQGTASGTADLHWLQSGRVDLAGTLDLSASLTRGEEKLEIDRGHGDIRWDTKGLIASLNLELPQGGRLQAEINSAQTPQLDFPKRADFVLDWKSLPLYLLQPLLPETRLTGDSNGNIQGNWQASGDLAVNGMVEIEARIARNDLAIAISRARSDFSWGPAGLKADLDIALADGGKLMADVNSPEPGHLGLPEQGVFQANWEALDLVSAHPFLPHGLTLTGKLSGKTRGRWFPEQQFEMTGNAGIGEGRLAWSDKDEGKVSAPVKDAEINWTWQGQSLKGEMTLALSDYGQLEGAFRLPLPARQPTAIEPGGKIQARFAGKLMEKGLLAALMPGIVQESQGALDFDLNVDGSWREPRFRGGLLLTNAGGYLPAAGIHLEEVNLQAEFTGDRLCIASFQLRSGPGRLMGDAEIQLDAWQIAGFRANIKGDKFQLVDLPELQMQVKPDLQVEGNLQQLKVRGEVVLSEVLIAGKEGRTPVERSQDVVIVDVEKPVKKSVPLDLDIRLRLKLGDHVLLKIAGIDAHLDGALNLMASSPTNVTAQGEINVVKGAYSAYGVKLKVTRGRIIFAGGPVDRPTLDVLALRTINDIQAGVRVSGTPRAPVVKLYSEPGMPDTDVLSYIVLGHPIGADSGQTSMLMAAAGALLSQGESTVLQDRLQRRLGLDVVDIESGNGNVESSMITIGKYLTPDLYISIGQGLLNNAREFQMRYSVSQHWEVETNVGVESGADLYYKIEFQ